jgi:hypothetical protein
MQEGMSQHDKDRVKRPRMKGSGVEKIAHEKGRAG